jgi:arylsulfatase A-like enzyme
LTVVAPLLPWVARNFAWTGNPLYPLATEWLGGPPWNAELLAADMHRPTLGSLSLLAFVRTLWQLTFASWGELLKRFGVFAVLGPAWLWLVPAALKKRALVLAAAAFVALSVLAFATTAWILRFAMVSLPMAALIVGQIRWAKKPRWLRAVAATTALTVVAANGTYAAREVLARTNGLALATTQQNDRGLLTAMAAQRPIELGTYPLAAELARRHPDARVMVVGDTVHAYLDVRHTHASVFNTPAIQPYLAMENPARALAADGYTHILLNPTELARLDAFAGAPRLSAKEQRQLEALVHALPCQLGDCSLASAAVLAVTPAPRHNVVLVSIDTLRADHLGCYGYPRATSPTLDRLARDGVRFANVSSTTSWTLPAHAALFTGLFDPLHGSIWDPFPLDPARVTLAEQLAARGYETAAVFTAPYLLPRFGLDQGFAEYHDATRYDKSLTGPEVLVASERGRTTDGALDWVESWLARRKQRPFFLFVHLFDVHPDFDPPAPYATMFDADYTGSVTGSDVFHNPAIHPNMAPRDLEHLVALYDGEIRYVDEHGIARLARLLERGGLLDTTVLAVTADHGEEFFEHGQFGHRHNLHRETTRVPLILRAPGLPAGKTVDTFVRSIDIMPTLLDLAGAPPSPEALGESLVPLARGVQPGPRREAYLLLKGGGLYLEALEDGRAKTLVDHRTGQATQYDLTADPGELAPSVASDEARRQLTAFRRVLAELRARLPRNTGSAPLDELTRQRLESLGYVDAP